MLFISMCIRFFCKIVYKDRNKLLLLLRLFCVCLGSTYCTSWLIYSQTMGVTHLYTSSSSPHSENYSTLDAFATVIVAIILNVFLRRS